jgi:PAS domain S-box-containing protein
MPTPLPLPLTEELRRSPADDYALLDTPDEALFDALTRLAAKLCAAPIALVGVTDGQREWFAATCGVAHDEPFSDFAFCRHAIAGEGLLEVPDAVSDARFAQSPLVTGPAAIRFFAGMPLRPPDGAPSGVLAIFDRRPRRLTPRQHAALAAIADAIVEQFAARRALLRLFDDARAELYRVDLSTRRVIFASDAALRNLGYTLDELRALKLSALLPSLAREARVAARLEELRARAGERLILRSRARRKDGTSYPVELRIERRAGHGADAMLVIARDLTEGEQAEQRIGLLSAAVEGAQDPIIIATPGANEREPGTIVYANAAFLRQTDATAETVFGRTAEAFYGPKTDHNQLQFMRRELLAGRSATVEFIAYRTDGSTFCTEAAARPLLDDAGRTTHFVVVQRDVTDQVVRGAELAMQNERLTAITSIAQQLFATLDSSLLVEALLAGVHELFGAAAMLYAPRAGSGFVTLSELRSSEDAPAVDDAFLERASASEICVVEADELRAAVRIAGSSGSTAYVLDVQRPLPFSTADVFAVGLLGQYFAVAARNVELYEELSSRRDAVVELNQVKNDLIAMLAHDFKGPLTTIVGFADVLADDHRIDNEARQYLEMISSSAMRLASLATDTLALSRLEQNELVLSLADVDLVALVRDVVRVFSVTRPIDLRASAGTLVVNGDESRLRQVIENLIGNAIKYSPGGESIEVALRARPRGVELAVRDRGIGIPDAERSKLFGRFARASNARALGIGGTGFGLYLSKTIMDLHGGKIEVESIEGHGSTFRVLVPVHGTQPVAAVRRIILLDTEGEARSYVAHALRGDGFAVSVAHTGDDVLQLLDEGAYHAALIDADRLEMAVPAFLRRASGRTALVCMGLRRPAKAGGWDAFVIKPFLMKDLYTAMDEALGRPKGARASEAEPLG